MATKILHKRNSSTGSIPTLEELELGELAINTYDGKLYTKTSRSGVFGITEIGEAQGEMSELHKVQEANQTGWRLLGRDPNNYGNIGQDAVDLSLSTISAGNGINGATGDKSFATGSVTVASGYGSTALGEGTLASGAESLATGNSTVASGYRSAAFGEKSISSGEVSFTAGVYTIAQNRGSFSVGTYNIGTSSDTILEVGIGIYDGINIFRKNALEIYNDGRLIAPELDVSLILSEQSLVTKEYVDSVAGGSGNLKSDGSVQMDAGYVPVEQQDISTKDYIDNLIINGGTF